MGPRSHQFQPLRLSTGWKIAWNMFYEIDPPRRLDSEDAIFFQEDMLLLQNQGCRILIDVSWMPYGPKGRFVLSAVEWGPDDVMPELWSMPLLQFKSKARQKVVAKLEQWTREKFDWMKVRRDWRKGKSRIPLPPSYIRLQKVYESVE